MAKRNELSDTKAIQRVLKSATFSKNGYPPRMSTRDRKSGMPKERAAIANFKAILLIWLIAIRLVPKSKKMIPMGTPPMATV